MRRHLVFILTLITAISIIAYLVITLNEQKPFYVRGEQTNAHQFLDSFRKSQRPLAELNLTSLYSRSDQFEIFHPLSIRMPLSFTDTQPACSTGQLGLSTSALPTPRCETNWSDPLVLKQAELLRILSHASNPREDFILQSPIVDGQGSSYAYLLYVGAIAPFNTADWVRTHLSFFKLNELGEVMSKLQIDDAIFGILGQLNEVESRSLVEGDEAVLTPKFLLLKNRALSASSPVTYLVYDTRTVSSALQNQGFELAIDEASRFCIERIGNACWTYSSKTAMAYVYRYSMVVLFLICSVFVTILIYYIKFVFEKNQEQIRHQTSLQVLSHEFRTPVSSMLLLLDKLQKSHVQLGDDEIDLVTKISSETFRLQRIVEMSKNYLESSSDKSKFKLVEIPSVNSWIEDLANELDERVSCIFLENDQAVHADPFWLRFAISNLVQNAFAHGKPPVIIRLDRRDSKIRMTVEDCGRCEFVSLKRMTKAFVKSRQSGGMGLGLSITQTIVSDWGGTLEFRSSPTSFSLSLQSGGSGVTT